MASLFDTKDNASLTGFLHLLRLRRALIVLILALVLLTTLGVTALLPRWYQSTTKIRVERPEGEVKLYQAAEQSLLRSVLPPGSGRYHPVEGDPRSGDR